MSPTPQNTMHVTKSDLETSVSNRLTEHSSQLAAAVAKVKEDTLEQLLLAAEVDIEDEPAVRRFLYDNSVRFVRHARGISTLYEDYEYLMVGNVTLGVFYWHFEGFNTTYGFEPITEETQLNEDGSPQSDSLDGFRPKESSVSGSRHAETGTGFPSQENG